ncbi:hypothetical protein LTR27_010350 [Elasticomyces elasticus]|nr:hypothetical protein LTR27_010350 [Elasticomyces elasticus]
MPTALIAKQLGRSDHSVRGHWANVLNVGSRSGNVGRRPFSEPDDEEILRMWRDNAEVRSIAISLRIPVSSVHLRLHNVLLSGGPKPLENRMRSTAGSKRQFSVEEFDRIAALVAAGNSFKAVAETFQMPLGTFNHVWRRVQARMKLATHRGLYHRESTLADKMNIIRLRNEEGLSYVEIAQKTSWSFVVIDRALNSSLNGKPRARKSGVPYTNDEDMLLIEGRERHGLTYAHIAAQMLPQRSVGSLVTRYCMYLKGRRNGTTTKAAYWTEAEDRILQNSLEQGNVAHSEIAGQLPGRTRYGVAGRISVLKRRERLASAVNADIEREAKVAGSAV